MNPSNTLAKSILAAFAGGSQPTIAGLAKATGADPLLIERELFAVGIPVVLAPDAQIAYAERFRLEHLESWPRGVSAEIVAKWYGVGWRYFAPAWARLPFGA